MTGFGGVLGLSLAKAGTKLQLWMRNAPQGKFWIFFTASIFFNIVFSIF